MTDLEKLSVLPELVGASHGELSELQIELLRGGLRDSSIQRYMGAARAWKRFCIDRSEPHWNASTATLLRWLDWRVRNATSKRAALKMSLAAARFLQRGYCLLHDVEAVPYTANARVQLDAFARTCTMNRSDRKVTRPLRLDELDAVVQRIRDDTIGRWGVSMQQHALLSERDSAMLIIGWWGALRADDLARLETDHVHMAPLGIELHIAASKTTHALLALAARPDCPRLCPLQALTRLRVLREQLGEQPESLFDLSTGDHVGRRIVTLFKRYGLPKGYTGHALRAGFATECATQGVPDKLVQAHGRWRNAQQHAEYVRLARLWSDTPTTRVLCPT